MIATLTEPDRRILSEVEVTVDAIRRRSLRCEVALHSLAAAELLAATHQATPGAAAVDARIDEGLGLQEALQMLATLPPHVLHDDAVTDALQHVLLAYLATR